MLLHFTAWILMTWLLSITWLDSSKSGYIYWAALVVLLWWVAWFRRYPRIPAKTSWQMLIYVVTLGIVVVMAVFTSNLLVLLVLAEIVVLAVVDLRMSRQLAQT